MIIDDEQGVADSLRRVLARHHEVDAFSDPRVALQALESGKVFDLVLCDLTMPYLSGAELFERVTAKAPQLASRFVFITGGATTAATAAFLAAAPNETLEKPFDAATVLELLTRTPSAE